MIITVRTQVAFIRFRRGLGSKSIEGQTYEEHLPSFPVTNFAWDLQIGKVQYLKR
jgi:hypothetical protein